MTQVKMFGRYAMGKKTEQIWFPKIIAKYMFHPFWFHFYLAKTSTHYDGGKGYNPASPS